MKEADIIDIRLPNAPDPPHFDKWQATVRQEVVAASGRGQAAFEWMLEVERPGVNFDDLSSPGRSRHWTQNWRRQLPRQCVAGPSAVFS